MTTPLISDATLAKIVRLLANSDLAVWSDACWPVVEMLSMGRAAATLKFVRACSSDPALITALEEANEEAARNVDAASSPWTRIAETMTRHDRTHAAGIALANSTPRVDGLHEVPIELPTIESAMRERDRTRLYNAIRDVVSDLDPDVVARQSELFESGAKLTSVAGRIILLREAASEFFGEDMGDAP